MPDPEHILGGGLLAILFYGLFTIFGSKSLANTGADGIASIIGVPIPGAKPEILTFPQNRALTEDEVFQLAKYMERTGLKVDAFNLLAMAEIESSFRPWAERYEPHINDYSVGLMQTLISTAQDLFNKGYRSFGEPTRKSLHNPAVSMYFGAAYWDWLKSSYPGNDLEWYVRAYNGGPGHNYNSATTAYWAKFKAARSKHSQGPSIITG